MLIHVEFSHMKKNKINDVDEKISVTFHYLSLFMIRCFFFFCKGEKINWFKKEMKKTQFAWRVLHIFVSSQ